MRVVLIRQGNVIVAYGPIESQLEAEAFAEFLARTVDPAEVVPLRSPTAEVLGWFKHETDRNDCTHGADCPVHPDVAGLHNFDAKS